MKEPMNNWKKEFREQFTTQVRIEKLPQDIDTLLLKGTPLELENFISQVERDAIQRTADALMLDEVEINNPFNDYVRGYVQAVKDLRTKRDKLLEECK